MSQDGDLIPVPKTEPSKPAEPIPGEIISGAQKEVVERFATGGNDKYGRFFLAALSGIPWIMPLSVIANLKAEFDQEGMNNALKMWLTEHQDKIQELVATINEILGRLDGFGDEVRARIESPEYLSLVRRGFRTWNEAETQEKRLMVKKLLTNAGAITLCADDQVRLFIDWIERYHEAHFAVMKEIYQNHGITKGNIWDNLHPEGRPQDNSAEAGLFSYLMRELNMGGIIHIEREVNVYGQTVRAQQQKRSSNKSSTLESPFEDTKNWELSALGQEFVRYVMEDVDPQLKGAE